MEISISSFKELCDLFGHIISDQLPNLVKNRLEEYPEVQNVALEKRGHFTMQAIYRISLFSDIDIQILESFINDDESIKSLVKGRQIKIIRKL